MPEHDGSGPPSTSTSDAPPEAVFDEPALPALDVTAALDELERVTRDFTVRLGEAQEVAGRDPEPLPSTTSTTTPDVPEAYAGAEDAFAARLHEAEREAREYLEHAKQRADSLVATMVAAVEREAAAIRREAEDGIRARWQRVEAEAQEHLEQARRVGEGMVAERQEQLADLSDGITAKAKALSVGLDDADRVRIQFEAFVRALAMTADRVAQSQGRGTTRTLRSSPRIVSSPLSSIST